MLLIIYFILVLNIFLLNFFAILRCMWKTQDSTVHRAFFVVVVSKFQTDISVGSSVFPLSALVVNNGFEIS